MNTFCLPSAAVRRPLAAALALAVACQAWAGPAVSRAGNAAPGHQAYAAADTAYRLYERGDHFGAVSAARLAVEFAPHRRDYRVLLAQALLAAGRLDEASHAVAEAARVAGEADALERVQADLQAAQARRAGEALYRALEAGDLQAAVASGSEAVRLAPLHAPYRIALVQTLLRERRAGEAEQVARDAPAQVGGDPTLQLLLALAQLPGSPPEATLSQAAGAVALAQRTHAETRAASLVAADLALASGRAEEALGLLQPLPLSDADAAARRDWARHVRATGTTLAAADAIPAIDCGALAHAGSCLLVPRALPRLPGYDEAAAGYAALQAGDATAALARARAATLKAPAQRDWRLLHLHAAVAAGELVEAETVADHVIASDSATDMQLVAQRAWIRTQLGNTAGAQRDAATALGSGALPPMEEAVLLLAAGRRADARDRLALAVSAPLPPDTRLQLAYLQVQAGDDAAALRAFQLADDEQALPLPALYDAGYAAMRAHQDGQALAFFDRAVIAQVRPEATAQRVLETRRMSAEIERTWGVLASITHRNGAGVAPGFGIASRGSDDRTTQAGIEAYWRPFGYRNGRHVEVFARGFASLDAPPGVWQGRDSFQGAVGARWKPLTDQNVVLSLGRVFGPNVQDSWLAQAAYSFDHGTELRLDVPAWWTTHVYAEVGRYFGGNTNAGSYGLATGTFGRSFTVGDSQRTVVYPHLFAGVEHQSRDPSARTSAGVGVGVALRHWFREDETRGPRSFWELSAQYRARVTGDDRLKGPYVSATLSF